MSDSIKRNSKGKIVFQGELDAPIIRPSDAQLQVNAWSEKAGNAPWRFPGINDEPWLAQARFGKLFALRKYFGCEHEDQWRSWFLLLYHLAMEVVPGFKVAPSGARPAGRPLEDFKEGDALVEAVAKVCEEKKSRSVMNACRILSQRKGKWFGKKAGALQRRYHRILKERSSFNYFVEYMSDLWGLEPINPRHRERLRAMPRLDPAEFEKRIKARAKVGAMAADKTSRR